MTASLPWICLLALARLASQEATTTIAELDSKTTGEESLVPERPAATPAPTPATWASSSSCLSSAISASDRRNISVSGQSFPLGLWALSWDAPWLTCNVMKIIAEEVLGYEVLVGPGGGVSTTAVDALGGCDDGLECLDALRAQPSQGTSAVKWHLAFETWPSADARLSAWEAFLPERAPERIGDMGYKGTEGHYLKPESLIAAINDEGLNLDWYRQYNASWHQPHKYFDKFDDIDLNNFKTCAEVLPQSMLIDYHTYFGDDGSVYEDVDATGEYKIVCVEDVWWLSPRCRDAPEKCIPYISYSAWGAPQMMQQAAHWGVPVAIANAASYDAWKLVVAKHRVLTYWWEPDVMFAQHDMSPVLFPSFNGKEWAAGFKITNFDASPLGKLASRGLDRIASDIHHVAAHLSFSTQDMLAMIKERAAGREYHDIACAWIHDNTDTWNKWVPDPTSCVAGQGLVDDAGQFLNNLSSPDQVPKGCEWCPPGHLSTYFGSTLDRICKPCSPGTSQNQPGKDSCEPCQPGYHAAEEGHVKCSHCPAGTFATGPGNVECAACPRLHETTEFLGSSSAWSCVCQDGFHRLHGHSQESDDHVGCEPCPGGMECRTGNSEPALQAGFWSAIDDSADRKYSIYRCRDIYECPGGQSGTCAPRREGIGCANCKANHKKSHSGTCEECGAESAVPIIVTVLVVIAGFIGMAMYAKVDVSKVKLRTLAAGICLGQTAVALQALTIFSGLRITWVEPYTSILKAMAVLTFDVEVLNMSCVFPDENVVTKYLATVLIYPVGVVILCSIFFTMNRAFNQGIGLDHVVNSIGLITLLLYLTLVMTGLTVFHCISSPNGKATLRMNPSVVCFEDQDWFWLATMGFFAVTVYGAGFMAYVIWVTLRYPGMLASGQGSIVMNRYRFMFQRFSVDRFYYTPIYLTRNLIVAILPVVFADYGHRQVFLLAFALMTFGFLNAWLQPWRGLLPNVLDAITTSGLVTTLLGAALLLDAAMDIVMADMQVVFSVVLLFSVFSLVGVWAYLLFRSFVPQDKFAAFLCHHKVGCAVGARLMKMELQQQLKRPIFLDSDSLDDLEDLLDIVRGAVDNLVILLTASTLSRPWCAGEISTAFSNGVNMVPVHFDDYTELTEEDLAEEAIAGRWPADAFAGCVAQGVTAASVGQAYRHLMGLRKIPCFRVKSCLDGDNGASMVAIMSVVIVCQKKVHASTFMDDASEGVLSPIWPVRSLRSDPSPKHAELELAVLASYTDPEAISTATLLARLVRKQTQWGTTELLHPHDVEACVAADRTPKHMAVVLTEGALTSDGFPKTLLRALKAWQDSVNIMTVKMERFLFPSTASISESIVPQVAKVLSVEKFLVEDAYKRLLSILSIPFSPSGSILVLEVEVSDIINRMQRGLARKDIVIVPGSLKSSSAAPAASAEDQPPEFED